MKDNKYEPKKDNDPIEPDLQDQGRDEGKEPIGKIIDWVAEKTGQSDHAGESPEDHKWSREKVGLARHEAEERMEDLEEIRDFAEKNAEKVVEGLNKGEPLKEDELSKDKIIAARHEAEERIEEITHHKEDPLV